MTHVRHQTSNMQPNGSEIYSTFDKHDPCKRMYTHRSLKYYEPETNSLCSANKYLH